MFPSLRVALSGLEKDAHYCVVLEMAPVSDCRFKFSGSQWVPAGGAEPQSAQRMYIHPDSPALGSHWQAQAVVFNKVKLTNNTLDSQGHVSLYSLHYQILTQYSTIERMQKIPTYMHTLNRSQYNRKQKKANVLRSRSKSEI